MFLTPDLSTSHSMDHEYEEETRLEAGPSSSLDAGPSSSNEAGPSSSNEIMEVEESITHTNTDSSSYSLIKGKFPVRISSRDSVITNTTTQNTLTKAYNITDKISNTFYRSISADEMMNIVRTDNHSIDLSRSIPSDNIDISYTPQDITDNNTTVLNHLWCVDFTSLGDFWAFVIIDAASKRVIAFFILNKTTTKARNVLLVLRSAFLL